MGKRYGIPVVFTCHTRYEDYLHYVPALRINGNNSEMKKKAVAWIGKAVIPFYMKWFANQCDLVLAPSAGMQRVLRGYGMKSRSAVLPTGLTDQFFQTDGARAAQIRRQYGKGKKYLLVTVSRLEREKNYGFLLRGISNIREKIGDDFHVLILGDGS